MHPASEGLRFTGFHCLTHFMHEHSGRLRPNTVSLGHLKSREALSRSGHFKADVKSLQKTKFHFVEQGISSRAFGITTLVARSGVVFADLASMMTAFPAYKSMIPLQFTEVLFTIFISFEAFSKLYDALSFKNVHFLHLI
ncbi:hypothetical protein SAMN03080617_00849 [Algoriphagus alkaliphilus]|uniref:Uncharacterized protein n=1 Tax=Algoriphagus alkaliphilus TaxID=279824 RepID=A0A1G5W2X7_9BACT|nr:hypothetical protein SAMN03080617_00849 [Algoriphagus alkaliphilus]